MHCFALLSSLFRAKEITFYNLNVDTDFDGLELSYGTDPLLNDTDGDGFMDGYELVIETDPLNANDYPRIETPEPEDNLLEISILVANLMVNIAILLHGFLRRSRPEVPPVPAPKKPSSKPKK